jgi:hypothetical protein
VHQLTYISTAASTITSAAIDDILAASRRNNARDRITGLLIHDGKRFLQALEGHGPLVEAAYARITADRRHHAAVMLSFQQVSDRQFGNWEMASHATSRSPVDGALSSVVDALVADLSDRNMKALFSSFARIRKGK